RGDARDPADEGPPAALLHEGARVLADQERERRPVAALGEQCRRGLHLARRREQRRGLPAASREALGAEGLAGAREQEVAEQRVELVARIAAGRDAPLGEEVAAVEILEHLPGAGGPGAPPARGGGNAGKRPRVKGEAGGLGPARREVPPREFPKQGRARV